MDERKEHPSQLDAARGLLEGEAPAPGRAGRFAFFLAPVILAAALAGVWLGYHQYPRLVSAARGVGLDFGWNKVQDGKQPIQYGQFMEIQGMIINPAGTDGTRYLMVNLGLESPSESVLEEIKTKEVVVRDTILKVLGKCTVTELADISRRTVLKQELRSAVNGILQKGRVDRMYFTQYVLQ